MAVGNRALGCAASRQAALMAAQCEAGSGVGRIGGGEPGPRQRDGDALQDKREDQDASGEPLPPVHRTLHHPTHAGPRLG